MIYPGFCGPSNPLQSPLADGERTINWYLEVVQIPSAPTGLTLYPTPGQRAFIAATSVTDVGTRALFVAGSHCYGVIGGGFYEFFANRTATRIGDVTQDQYPATISYNGTSGGQILVTSGTNAYLYTMASGAFAAMATLAGITSQGGAVNGRFLAFNRATGLIRVSGVNDGATWDASLVFGRGTQPDPLQAMVIRAGDVVLVGTLTGEVWQDVGAYPQPFAPLPGASFDFGTPAPFSVVVAGDTVKWLSQSDAGSGQMVSMESYSPQPISSYAVDTALSTYGRTSTVTTCEAFSYWQDGHPFTVWNFPDPQATWVVDGEGPYWHERGTWQANLNRFNMWTPRVHCFAFGKHLVGDRTSGQISEMDVTIGTEANGGILRRVRIAPPLWAVRGERLVVSALEVMVDTGLGVTSGQGVDPQMMLQTSTDGRTWGNEAQAGAGRLGDYSARVFWQRCGSSEKIWVPQISVSDPIPWRLSGAQIDGSGILRVGRAA